MAGLLDFLQAASNAAASNVTGPIDLLSWALKKGGVPVGDAPMLGSEWMKRQGLMRDVPQSAASLAGETVGLLAPIGVSAKAPQIAQGLLAGQDLAKQGAQAVGTTAADMTADYMARQGLLQPATVWHGSPHKFDKFDASKIGTGEGAQAYGHGLYLSDAPDVAKTYKDLNPTALSAPIRAFRGAELTPGTPEYHAATLLDGMGLQQARKTVAGWIKNADPRMAREAEGWKKTLETLNAATSKADFKTLKNTGNLYKVDLPDSAIAKMLDWDKPLSQQDGMVQKVFDNAWQHSLYRKRAGGNVGDFTGADLVNAFGSDSHSRSLFADDLRRAGIPGIRYLDGGSRNRASNWIVKHPQGGENVFTTEEAARAFLKRNPEMSLIPPQLTSNYVVFPGEEGLLKILERNGVPLK